MSHVEQVMQILNELIGVQVEHLVLCPGGRNAPLAEILSQPNLPFKVHTHMDERAASFYALGLSQSSARPAVVIVTSGTAVSETLSACIEAHYTSTPLVILSADRPKRFRGSGAPQTIRQTEVLKSYVTQVHDLEKSNLDLEKWDRKSPIHINVCFDEPLLSREDLSKLNFSSPKKSLPSNLIVKNSKTPPLLKKPLVIVSGSYGFNKTFVREKLQNIQAPIYFESTSGLKNLNEFSEKEIHHPEMLIKNKMIDGVIRIGHVPTHRVWRDLEFLNLPVISFSQHPFSGLSGVNNVSELTDLEGSFLSEIKHPNLDQLLSEDRSLRENRLALLSKYPQSEAALIATLQNFWNENDSVYLGNSLPIREWDLVQRKNFSVVTASRGANGIDGQLSTYFGHAVNCDRSLGVFGDLTALYDMNAFWVMKQMTGICHITVINNSGGMIFDSLFGKEIFLNRHNLNFKPLAEMWGLPYQRLLPDQNPFGSQSQVLEVCPDHKQTQAFQEAIK